MSVNFMNPFLVAAKTVLEIEAGIGVTRGELALHQSGYTGNDITILLNIVGDVRGIVIYSLDYAMALKIVSAMLGQPQEEFDELAQSGIAEMGNVITGTAATGLAKAGYTCNISVPTLITGRGAMISTLDFQRLSVPLQTEFGTLNIHLALREDPNHANQRQLANAPSGVIAQPAAPDSPRIAVD